MPTERPSDHDCGWRCPARAGYRERRDTSTERTRRTRPENTASRTSDRDSTGSQAADDTLTRIAPGQQRQRQQSGRRKLDGHARVHHGGKRDRDERDQKQSKHKMRARTASKHARNIHTPTSEVQSTSHERDRRTSKELAVAGGTACDAQILQVYSEAVRDRGAARRQPTLGLKHDPCGDSAGLNVGDRLVYLIEWSCFADYACLACIV